MPKWKVKINIDVELIIHAEQSADAESSALSRLINDVLNEGIVSKMDPRTVYAEELADENKFNRRGVI